MDFMIRGRETFGRARAPRAGVVGHSVGVQGDVGGDVGAEGLAVQGDFGEEGAADAVGLAEAVALSLEEEEAVPHSAFGQVVHDASRLVWAADEIVGAWSITKGAVMRSAFAAGEILSKWAWSCGSSPMRVST